MAERARDPGHEAHRGEAAALALLEPDRAHARSFICSVPSATIAASPSMRKATRPPAARSSTMRKRSSGLQRRAKARRRHADELRALAELKPHRALDQREQPGAGYHGVARKVAGQRRVRGGHVLPVRAVALARAGSQRLQALAAELARGVAWQRVDEQQRARQEDRVDARRAGARRSPPCRCRAPPRRPTGAPLRAPRPAARKRRRPRPARWSTRR